MTKEYDNFLEVVAIIDFYYYSIRRIEEKVKKDSGKSPIEKMIDDETGYGHAMALEAAELTHEAMTQIIRHKKILNDYFEQSHDVAGDIEHLKGLTDLIERMKYEPIKGKTLKQ